MNLGDLILDFVFFGVLFMCCVLKCCCIQVWLLIVGPPSPRTCVLLIEIYKLVLKFWCQHVKNGN